MTDVTFLNPPLVEVSFGIQFKRPLGLKSAHFGLFWSTLLKEFPETSDQPPVGFPDQTNGWPLPRVWLVHRDKSLLMQVQSDRFYINWRRLQPEAEYPRFNTICPVFLDYWKQWHNFLAEMGVGPPEPIGAELHYVNQLDFDGAHTSISEVASWFVPLSAGVRGVSLPRQESIGWHAAYSTDRCLLTADLNTLVQMQPQGAKRLQFEIKGQSQGELPDIDRVRDWMALANDSIVSLFVQLTSDYAQKEVWKRVS